MRKSSGLSTNRTDCGSTSHGIGDRQTHADAVGGRGD
jgi:hypothetical protein